MPERAPGHRSLRFGAFEALIVVALLGVAAVAWRSDSQARSIVSREGQALAFARQIFSAEKAFRESRRQDEDGDGNAEYGTLEALVAAGLVSGPLSRDDDAQFLEHKGYRVEILLPAGETPKGLKEWSRSGGPVDARLAAATFAVVALPATRDRRALRAFYLDGTGYGYSVDGVYSPDRDPRLPPPRYELRGGDKGEDGGRDGGPSWRPFERPAGAPVDASNR